MKDELKIGIGPITQKSFHFRSTRKRLIRGLSRLAISFLVDHL